jgi:hypothetical protein
MALDNKYGRVETERGSIDEDEPVFVFRAQDALSGDVLRFYASLLGHNGASADEIATVVGEQERFAAWQSAHADRVKVPS